MTVYDLIGVPFPITEPEFVNDKPLLKLIRRIEHDIEIKADLDECVAAIQGLEALLKEEQEFKMKIGFREFGAIADGAVSHAVHLYAKAFNGNKRRRRLDANNYLSNASNEIKSAHKFFEAFRNQYFAHAEMRINEHKLHVLPSNVCGAPRASPNIRTERLVLCKSYCWSDLAAAAQFFASKLGVEIGENSRKLDIKLTVDQKRKVNSMRQQGVQSLCV